MAKKNENREFINIRCSECKNMPRKTQKNKKNTPDKLEINKFCPVCRKVTLHKEHRS